MWASDFSCTIKENMKLYRGGRSEHGVTAHMHDTFRNIITGIGLIG